MVWVKLNSDGSVMGWLGRAGAEGMISGNGRLIIEEMEENGFEALGMENSMLAEIWVVRDGLIMTKDMGFDSIVVELDAKTIFDLISSNNDKNHLLNTLIAECRMLAGSFWRVKLQHIYHEVNGVAGYLAKITRDNCIGVIYFERPPIQVANLLLSSSFFYVVGETTPKSVSYKTRYAQSFDYS